MTSKTPVIRPKNPWFRIQVLNRQRLCKLFPSAVARLCAEILQELGQSTCAVSVVFVGARKMRSLNRHYRGRNYATDVLSFSYGGDAPDAAACDVCDLEAIRSGDSDDGLERTRYLGDVVVSPEVACRNAARYGTLPEKEIRKLLVHGILHLLGWDHEADGGEMNRVQARLLRRRGPRRIPAVARIRALSKTQAGKG